MVAVMVSIYHIAPRHAWEMTPRDYFAAITVHERIGKGGDTRYDATRAKALIEHLKAKGLDV